MDVGALRFLSDYYCHSGQVPNDDVEAISIVWLQIRQSLETGARREDHGMLLHWSCDESRPSEDPWPAVQQVLEGAV